MKSFPSSLNESEQMYGSNKAQSFINSFDIERLKAINLNTSIPVIQEQLKEVNINASNFQRYPGMITQRHTESGDNSNSEKDYNNIFYESPLLLPASAIKYAKDYDWVYKYQHQALGGDIKKEDKSVSGTLLETTIVPSMFNGIYGVRSIGLTNNTPLLNDFENNKYDSNIDDCSIRTLCALSKNPNSPIGMHKFKYADFMYCKDLGKVANNHLVVLRKFPHPIGDHIGRLTSKDAIDDNPYNFKTEGDVGRLISWFDTEDNKLEDIVKFSYSSTWKELNAEIEQKNSNAENSNSGVLGMIANAGNPQYNTAAAQGHMGNHSLWTWLGSKASTSVWSEANVTQGVGQNIELLSNYDTYKVYTPKNTIQSNHIYEGKIEFSHEFTLNFSYELRGYDNINPRSAFLDLLGNILEVTGRRGKFWGGSRKTIGPEQDTSTYYKVSKFIDKKFDQIPGFMASIKSGTGNLPNILGSLGNLFSSAVDAMKNFSKEDMAKAAEAVDNLRKSSGLDMNNFLSATKGMLKNQLGRPQLYAWHSLVPGDNVGLWHVTIGNPRNPILSIGNLILTNAQITQSGPLGLDDFPTQLKVTVTLKHPRPRDITDIGRMYTNGTNALYLHFGGHKLSKYFADDGVDWESKHKAGDNNTNGNTSKDNSANTENSATNNNGTNDQTQLAPPSENIKDNINENYTLMDPSFTSSEELLVSRTNTWDYEMLYKMINEVA